VSDSAIDGRLVPFEACFNFRDLGGYETVDGRRVRWGALFRSDTLHRMTVADLDQFRALGIRTVFDLRASQELDEDGGLDASVAVTHVHLPVLDTVRAPAERRQQVSIEPAEAYAYMTDVGRDALARLFDGLVGPHALPAVFHCTAGKDRTGIAAALLLGALGVDEDTIVADYALTELTWPRTEAWVREREPETAARWATYPDGALTAKAETMRAFLGALQEQHGTLRDTVRALGVSTATLDALDAALLEDDDPSAA
jgi:protein-tyrosine phosphatase